MYSEREREKERESAGEGELDLQRFVFHLIAKEKSETASLSGISGWRGARWGRVASKSSDAFSQRKRPRMKKQTKTIFFCRKIIRLAEAEDFN